MKKFLSLILIILMLCGCNNEKNKEEVNINFSNEDITYLDQLFNKETIVDIKIEIDEENAKELYADVSKEEYVHANVTINGELYEDVGIRTKGNWIYSIADRTDNPDYKWAYRIKFDKYNKEQTFHGLTTVALNSNLGDPTYLKEILNYGFYEEAGLEMPYYTFGNMTINGEDFGLVTFVEFYHYPYIQRVYNTTEGNLYKPNVNNDDINGTGPKYVNAGLKFIDYNFNNYSAVFEETVTDDTTDDDDKLRLIKILEEIKNENTEHFDVENYIKYLAITNFISSSDTYTHSGKNFYIYENNNYLTLMPYDLNLTYANYMTVGNSINFDILMDGFNKDMSDCDRPLTCVIRRNETYYNKYKSEVKNFIDKYITSNKINNLIDKYDNLIKDYLINENYDFNKEEHIEGIKQLKLYFQERTKYVNSIFNGTEYTPNPNYDETKLSTFKEELYTRKLHERN